MSILTKDIPLPTFMNKMSRKELIVLLTSMAYTITAGLTIQKGLESIINDTSSKSNKYVPRLILKRLEDGLYLWEIFKENEKLIGTGMWQQLKAAHQAGKTAECLMRIVEQLKHNIGITAKIRGALVYPSVILLAGLGTGYYMFTQIIPQVSDIFIEYGSELPLMTRQALAITDVLVNHGILLLCIIAFLITAFVLAVRGPLSLQWARFLTRVPVVGYLIISVNYSSAYMIVADMIENGSTQADSLSVATDSVKNKFIRFELREAIDRMVSQGLKLADSLALCQTVPPLDQVMLNAGQISGRTVDLLRELSVQRMKESHDTVNQLLDLMSPITLVIVGGIVAYVVIAVYQPMMSIATVIGQ